MSGPKIKTRTLLALLGCLLLFNGVVLAQESAPPQGVRITASKSGSYDLDKQVFMGSGDVEISYGDLVLTGEELQIDLLTGELVLQGGVTLFQDNQEIRGDFLTYNLETGAGKLGGAQGEIPLPEQTGTIYLKGDGVTLTDQSYVATNARFTTCDLPSSHYHLATKELELIPGEKVIIRGVTYYEGNIPLFYWPYLVIPLDRTDRDRFFTLPVLGYGEREGYYLKNTFNYYLTPKSSGHLYLDLYSRLGIGLGVRHFYELEDLGKGSFYLYGIPSQAETENAMFKGAFNHEIKGETWALRTATSKESSWERQEFTTENRYTLTLPKLSMEGWYIYRDNPRAQVKKYEEYGGRWSQELNDQLNLNLRANWTKRQTTETLFLLDYLAEGRYRQGKHTVTLAVQQQYNPDLLKTSTQPWRSVQRIPELKWEVSDLGVQALPLRSQLVIGRYEENPSSIRDTRAYGQVSLRTKTWAPTATTSLSYQGDLNTALYGSGSQQTWAYGRVTLNQKLTDRLQLSSTYSQREAWGLTPFLFDRQKPVQDVSARLSYSDSKWQASLNSSYNLKTRSFGLLVLQSRWRPNDEWGLDLYANYDLNKNKIQRIVPMVEYKGGEVDIKLGGRYLAQSQVWDLLDARLTIPVGETWLVSYEGIYEPPKGLFTQGKVTLTKDLHCRKISASYDHVARRVALQYTINAFPSLPIGWDSQGGLGLFDLDQVSEIIGGMEQ